MEKRSRWAVCTRVSSCALLIALLAACGSAGTEKKKPPGVPIAAATLDSAEISSMAMEEIGGRLKLEREEELALLESVIAHPDADSRLVSDALEQKTQIAARMETEAQVRACLYAMGYDAATVVCGPEMITLIVPQEALKTQKDRVQMIDAAAGQTGFDAGSVKIILAKK